MKNIKAFTLFETLIVINLSVFFLMILFLTHRIVIQESKNIDQLQLTNIFELKKEIEIDFEKATSIYMLDNDFILINPTDTLIYSFDENIINKNSQTIYNEQFQFIVYENSETKIINQLELIFSYNNQPIIVSFSKKYSPFFNLNHRLQNFEY